MFFPPKGPQEHGGAVGLHATHTGPRPEGSRRERDPGISVDGHDHQRALSAWDHPREDAIAAVAVAAGVCTLVALVFAAATASDLCRQTSAPL